jgi:hypothetical protein
MRIRCLEVAAVAVLVSFGGNDARASSWVTVMACDSALVQGTYYPQVTFKVQNQGPYSIQFITAFPIASPSPGDSCRAVGAVGPPNWSATVDPSRGWVTWRAEEPPILPPGQVLEGFQLILTSKHSCCYEMYFYNVINPAARESDCFECDMPVPGLRRTWGALKSLYR